MLFCMTKCPKLHCTKCTIQPYPRRISLPERLLKLDESWPTVLCTVRPSCWYICWIECVMVLYVLASGLVAVSSWNLIFSRSIGAVTIREATPATAPSTSPLYFDLQSSIKFIHIRYAGGALKVHWTPAPRPSFVKPSWAGASLCCLARPPSVFKFLHFPPMASSEDQSSARFSIDDNDRFVIESLGRNILLPKRYKFVRPIGSGGGGMVM